MATAPAYTPDALIAADINAYLAQHQRKSLLRFITCGSVDDGKSTLIGRRFYGALALGWRGSARHWALYESFHKAMAALAVPLVKWASRRLPSE